jgi:type VI secretion system protein ImpF
MAKIRADQPLVPSVLDRLIDYEPGVSRETARTRSQLLSDLKQSVRRDLENLLNTRWRCASWPPNLDEIDSSVANYGIPDFTASNCGAGGFREQLRRIIETTIRNAEPRFKTVRVKLKENVESVDRTLRFQIDALLLVEPAPEPVVFDSTLEPVTGSVEVKGASS